jgi:hypothetical protein
VASWRKIAQLVEAGATVMTPGPTASPRLGDALTGAGELEPIAATLRTHENTAAGAGRVIRQRDFAALLAADALAPDFDYTSASGLVLHAAHRRTDDADIYFVANGTAQAGGRSAGSGSPGRRPNCGIRFGSH